MLNIKNLNFNYSGKNNLFTELDLSLSAGKIYGLLGKNGTGKTTLLRIIAGLLFPSKGSTQILAMEARYRLPAMLQEIYFLPEEFTLPEITIGKYVKIYAPFYPRFNHEHFASMLKDFSLSLKDALTAISYGQKKKFLLAFGLASDAKLLLLDEPTNGLDIPSKSVFRRIVAGALTEERTFIISTHQVREVENLIDSVVILDVGKIIFNHDLAQVATQLNFVKGLVVDTKDVLYQERVLGGVAAVTVNRGGEESLIDLELLFNAVLANPETIKNLFQFPEGE